MTLTNRVVDEIHKHVYATNFDPTTLYLGYKEHAELIALSEEICKYQTKIQGEGESTFLGLRVVPVLKSEYLKVQ